MLQICNIFGIDSTSSKEKKKPNKLPEILPKVVNGLAGSLLSKWVWYKLVRLSTRPEIILILSILLYICLVLGYVRGWGRGLVRLRLFIHSFSNLWFFLTFPSSLLCMVVVEP